MKVIPSFYLFLVTVFISCACTEIDTPANEVERPQNNTDVYKVIAHRGGSAECGRPDNSVSSLKYAIYLRCYASECDVMLTKDQEIILAHPTSGYLVNGLEPYKHTLAEIRAAGKLANGEVIPTLRDFITVLQNKDQNPFGMHLWMDIKRLLKNDLEVDVNNSINACYRACEIINEMKANDLCELLIPTGDDIFGTVVKKVTEDYKVKMAWATCTSPTRYGNAWAQLSYDKIFGNTTYGPMDYINAGVPLSVYNVDDETTMDLVLPYYPKLKGIFTNYPSALIKKIIAKGYDLKE